jgi:O-antigen ligase
MKAIVWPLSVVTSLMVVTHNFNRGIEYGDWYYYIPIIILAILIVIGTRLNVDSLMAMLPIVCLVSIVFNEVPIYFRPYERLAVFIIFLSLVSPLIRSTALNKFRFLLFDAINNFIVAAVIASFLLLIAGSGMSYNYSGFVGLFSHSMVLGPVAAISMLVSINKANTTERGKILHGLIAVAAFITCIAAASRSALLGGLIGLLVFFLIYYKKRFFAILKPTLLFVAAMSLVLLYFGEHAANLFYKFDYAAKHGGILTTRASEWENRIQEFKSSPIIGIGFSSATGEGDFDDVRGVVEPGSSWLGVLSMTGVMGMILLVLIIGKYILCIYRMASIKREYAFLAGILTFFLIHMFAEGYIFAAGSTMFFYFWLLIGVIDILTRREIRRSTSPLKVHRLLRFPCLH